MATHPWRPCRPWGSIRPDLAQFSVHAGDESAQVAAREWPQRRHGLRPAQQRRLQHFELRCTPEYFTFRASDPSWDGANHRGQPTSLRCLRRHSRTEFSAHFLASHGAKPQISGLRSAQTRNREPSQVLSSTPLAPLPTVGVDQTRTRANRFRVEQAGPYVTAPHS